MRPRLETEFPFLARLTEAGRTELAALPATRVPGGRRLLARGDPANGVYLVVGGALRIYYVAPDGREATLYRVEPGGTCVLALSATFEDGPYPAWVDAGARGVTFVRVPAGTFHRLVDRENAFRSFVMAAMSGRLFELMLALEERASAQMDQRVARYLLLRHDEERTGYVHVSQAGIASELGTARGSASSTPTD
jgi:CRP/FNR family transcriptional regulator